MTASDDAADPPAPYDWNRRGRHRLRAPDGVVIDLPVPVAVNARVWVATIWPDDRVAGGWARAMWESDPIGRGWRLPMQLAAGDVIEFGADTPTRPIRWFGIMDSYEPDRWATIQGPYTTPADAWRDAQRLLALERFLPTLPTDPPKVHAVSERTGREHRHRRHRRL
jgi:hypothetical protein